MPLTIPAPDENLAVPPRDVFVQRYGPEALEFVRAERLDLLADGRETFPAMLAAIEEAQETVALESYVIENDDTGRRFRDALVAAAGRGAAVRVLYDDVGSLHVDAAYRAPLLDAGIEVATFHPLRLSRPSWAWNRRDHRKILVVDGRISFTGGVNIADEQLPREAGGDGWRDNHVRIEGEAVAARFAVLFEYGWRKAHKFIPAVAPGTPPKRPRRNFWSLLERAKRELRLQAPQGAGAHAAAGERGVLVRVVGNAEFSSRRRIRRAYLRAIRLASRYVLIENAYFIPDRVFREALKAAVRRGVVVGVVVARESDVPAARHASRHLYDDLLAGGVRIFEWCEGMMHSKCAVVDDVWAIVGSYNLDRRSLGHNLEAVAEIVDVPFAARLRDRTMADLARCREVTREEHARRGWRLRLLERLAWSVRWWL